MSQRSTIIFLFACLLMIIGIVACERKHPEQQRKFQWQPEIWHDDKHNITCYYNGMLSCATDGQQPVYEPAASEDGE